MGLEEAVEVAADRHTADSEIDKLFADVTPGLNLLLTCLKFASRKSR